MSDADRLETRVTTHDLRLYDVTDDGRLAVEYRRVAENATMTEGRHVSLRLPPECALAFDEGRVAVDDLDAETLAWIDAETDAVNLVEAAA